MIGRAAERPAVIRFQLPHFSRRGRAPCANDRSRPRPRGDHRARADALDRHVARGRRDHSPGNKTQFVSNRCVMLRAAELVGLLGAVGRGDGAAAPRQAPPRGLPRRALIVGRHRENAALPLDEHVAHVGGGACDERDAQVAPARGPRAQCLREHARLPEAATREEQPPAPLARGLELLWPCVLRPLVAGGLRARFDAAPQFGVDLSEARPCRLRGERQRGRGLLRGAHRRLRSRSRGARRAYPRRGS